MATTDHIPRLFVLAGTNGAGKSSIGGAVIRTRGGHYFNPDEAAAAIRQAQPHLSHTQANSAAWHEGKRLLQHAIAKGLDYNFETTLGGRSFARLLQEAAGLGFEVRIWFVGLASPEHHLARVKARVRKGGHNIPEADIRRRFDQSRLQLIQLLPHLTELRVYDNTDEADPHLGQAPRPRLLLHWQRPAGVAPQVLHPLDASALSHTPDWAKPVVMAALKASAEAGSTQPKPTVAKRASKVSSPGSSSAMPRAAAPAPAPAKASTSAARPKRNRPAT